MSDPAWTTAHIPDQHGRTAVITGANTGLGFETAKALAARGATVILAVRNLDKGKEAVARITETTRGADVSPLQLDLSSLSSVRATAEELRANHERIDLLINNAGVMYTPQGRTTDGFETQFGTCGAMSVHDLGHRGACELRCAQSVVDSRVAGHLTVGLCLVESAEADVDAADLHSDAPLAVSLPVQRTGRFALADNKLENVTVERAEEPPQQAQAASTAQSSRCGDPDLAGHPARSTGPGWRWPADPPRREWMPSRADSTGGSGRRGSAAG